MRSLIFASLLVVPIAVSAQSEHIISKSVHDFIDLNCFDCHNEVDKEGGLDLENAKFDPNDLGSMNQWTLIFDRVKDGEMPPEEDMQPPADEKSDFIAALGETLHEVSTKQQQEVGRVRSRRLNRAEYEKTVQDLLGVDIPLSGLIPEDATQEGFNNVADAQQMSYHLLQTYLAAADAGLDEAFNRALAPAEAFNVQLDGTDIASFPSRNRGPWLWNDQAVSVSNSGNYQGRMEETTVPESGWYRIRVSAHAIDPPEGRGVWTAVRSGFCYAKAPLMFWVGSFQANLEPEVYEFTAWILEGHRLEIRPFDYTLKRVGAGSINEETFTDPTVSKVAMDWIEMERIYKGPTPKDLRRQLFGNLQVEDQQLISSNPKSDLARLMERFAIKAFRRPVSENELAPYLALAFETLDEGLPLKEAIYSGYRALLCSPRFLYFNEPVGKLDDYSIASRLSYFLWGTFPDNKLLGLAKQKKLSKPSILKQQVNRMLDDPRSEVFIKEFTDQWLNLKDIDFTTPDSKLYPEFDLILQEAMVGETHAFLREMIRDDLSVTNVIDSDFTMLNERLAHHYGIKGVSGTDIRKVTLKPEHRRGGIITHASVHKVTANGTTTSPVVRGVWMMEKIMGQKPLPPPANVPAIEPDIRGAQSIREQLDKHRNTPDCAACHVKIDPPGFALENYDVIGGWRQNYRAIQEKGRWQSGPEVDPSFVMPDGTPFNSMEEFKAILLNQPEKIAHNLVEKCIIYSTGASIEFADREVMEDIIHQISDESYGFRSLIHAVVQSPIFLNK
jgi:hypothetical protein